MNDQLNRFYFVKIILLCFFTFNLVGCKNINNKVNWLDYREKHETLDDKFISTIQSGTWKPIKADPSDAELFYLPDGKTMARHDFKGLVSSNALEQYLNNILKYFLEFSPISGVQAKVQLVGDNAYGKLQATPDGVIIVPLRFLKTSESEDEIAWLLAHELSHIILTHHDSDWVGRYHEKLNASLGSVLDMTNNYIAMAKKYGASARAEQLDKMVKIYETSMLMHDVANGSLFPAWKRAQEDEADLLAVDLCVKAGYSIDESDTVLAKLGQWAENNDKKRKKLFDKYKAEFKKDLATFKDPEKSAVMNNFVKITSFAVDKLAKLWKITADEVRYELNKTHRYIPERQKSLLGYSERFYDDLEVDPNFKIWGREKSRRKNKSLFKAYNSAWLAQEEFDLNGSKTATRLISKAFRQDRHLNTQSYPRWIYYNVRNEQKKNNLASRNLEIALQNATPSSEIFKLYIAEQIQKKNYSRTRKVLDRAWREFGKPPALYPFQIKVSKLRKNNLVAKRYFDECTKMAIDKETKKRCKEEFGAKF